MNPEAEELNEKIKQNNPNLFSMLSEKGKNIFFPKKGILGQTAEAKGKEIDATVGVALEEDGSPMRLKSIASNIININPKDIFLYAPSFGLNNLREKWKELIYEKNPSLNGKEISLPVVTNALTHGLSIAGYMFVEKDDKIISPDLFWGNYKLVFINAYGATIETFPTFVNENFNVEGLRDKLLDDKGKKIVLLNFPNNPCGYTPTNDEVDKIVNTIKEAAETGNNIVVLIDDAYFGLVYKDGVSKESIFSRLSDLNEKVVAIKLDGATKEDYVWGLRVGFVTYGMKNVTKEVYEALEAKTAGAIRGNISNASNLSQSLILNAFNSPGYNKEKNEKYNLLKRRFEAVRQALSAHKEFEEVFEALPYNSGYFMCVKLKDGLDAEKVRQRLLQDYNTGVIVTGNIIRLAFSAVPVDKMPKLFENLYSACKDENKD
jgi:aspartate/methionine/tyrosine aminotransferase